MARFALGPGTGSPSMYPMIELIESIDEDLSWFPVGLFLGVLGGFWRDVPSPLVFPAFGIFSPSGVGWLPTVLVGCRRKIGVKFPPDPEIDGEDGFVGVLVVASLGTLNLSELVVRLVLLPLVLSFGFLPPLGLRVRFFSYPDILIRF